MAVQKKMEEMNLTRRVFEEEITRRAERDVAMESGRIWGRVGHEDVERNIEEIIWRRLDFNSCLTSIKVDETKKKE